MPAPHRPLQIRLVCFGSDFSGSMVTNPKVLANFDKSTECSVLKMLILPAACGTSSGRNPPAHRSLQTLAAPSTPDPHAVARRFRRVPVHRTVHLLRHLCDCLHQLHICRGRRALRNCVRVWHHVSSDADQPCVRVNVLVKVKSKSNTFLP